MNGKLIKVYSNECRNNIAYSIQYDTKLNITDSENHLLAWLKAKKNGGV